MCSFFESIMIRMVNYSNFYYSVSVSVECLVAEPQEPVAQSWEIPRLESQFCPALTAESPLGDFTLWGHDCLLCGAERAVERITETTKVEPCLSGLVGGVIITVCLTPWVQGLALSSPCWLAILPHLSEEVLGVLAIQNGSEESMNFVYKMLTV